jgi:hypothetical protein
LYRKFGKGHILEETEETAEVGVPEGTRQWLEEKHFEPVGCYLDKTSDILMAIWQQKGTTRTFIKYAAPDGTRLIDICTDFENHRHLTTSSSVDTHVLPKMYGSFSQSFDLSGSPGQREETLWIRHVDAELFLEQHAGCRPKRNPKPALEEIRDYLSRQNQFIRGLFLGPFRWPWWYFVRRKRLHLKTVEEQFKR